MTTESGWLQSLAGVMAWVVFLAQPAFGAAATPATAQGASSPNISNVVVAPAGDVDVYRKIEFTFDMETQAPQPYWPFDLDPPAGVPPRTGVSAYGVFVDPERRQYLQPAFRYQGFTSDVRQGAAWLYPTTSSWKVRFTPNQAGEWRYRLMVRDAGGSFETVERFFRVRSKPAKGFVRLSESDSRYFEFEDRSLFSGLGFQAPHLLSDPIEASRFLKEIGGFGVNFVRIWLSSVFGSAWNPYVGARDQYRGYLPVTGLVPVQATDEPGWAIRLDYEPAGDTGWFDACRLYRGAPVAVKRNTKYLVRVEYLAAGLDGPRTNHSQAYGLVAKLGGYHAHCYEPGTSSPVTNYGVNSENWTAIQGVWNSEANDFLPMLHLGLENVNSGRADVRRISIREQYPDGQLGPELLDTSPADFGFAPSQRQAFVFDRMIDDAESAGIYLKVVLLEKDDKLWLKLSDDGSYASERDNLDGFYGLGRNMNRTRWLQQTWWRYAQARWGYSTSIHSWELINEGDPSLTRHYELADEFGRFMHQGVFLDGEYPAELGDGSGHPNDHLVTTSFWSGFPASSFWSNSAYTFVDYADLHAYIATSPAPLADRLRMEGDAAYYRLWHGRDAASQNIGKPIVRGEAGMTSAAELSENSLPLDTDSKGIWLHNFLWSGLDAAALYEVYWWRSHIWGPRGDGRWNYRLLNHFLEDLNLNRGGYEDWDGSVTGAELRVVGQKNIPERRLHLWIQNPAHTWRNVAERESVAPVSANVFVPGFPSGEELMIEKWDTWSPEASPVASKIRVDEQGRLRIPVEGLQSDFAIKVGPRRSPRLAPARGRQARTQTQTQTP